MDGIRTVKTNGSTIHHYTLNGSQIVTETWTTKSSSGAETPNHFLVYLYDENGAPVGLQYRNKTYGTYTFDTYYFEKNLQGDIIAIYTENGTKIGSYTYDAWGNCTVSTESGTTTIQKRIVRTLNPFRYRGYYYDTDTGLYYLQSRYYNPQWGRFLNADGYVNANGDLIGFNMYAYCSNSPVFYTDPTGEESIWEWLKSLFGGGDDEKERDSYFTEDVYELPPIMNPYLDFGWDINRTCMQDYRLADQYCASYIIDDVEAREIQTRTNMVNFISSWIDATVNMAVLGKLPIGKIGSLAISTASFLSDWCSSGGANVSNGTYHVIIGLYRNSKDEYFLVRRIQYI